MEKSLDPFMYYLKEQFGLEDGDLRTYSPLTLAYIGDAVYDLVMRTLVVKQGNAQTNKLHKRVSQLVKASAQAELADRILPMLTPEEEQVYKRGRNAKPYSTAKNASLADYNKATGLEALTGYLYLKEDTKRIVDLIKMGLDKGEER